MRHCIGTLVALVGVCVCSPLLRAETDESESQPIEISTVTGSTNRSSVEMMSAFREKIASHSNLFSLATNLDDSAGLVFEADCKSREKSNDVYVCFYTSYYAGGVVKTPLGSGMYAAKSIDDVADNLLASMAQDVAERWNSAMRSNAIKIIESCLSPTSSGCAVPVPLTPELRTKVLNLAQSLQKGELKK
jgi:hypothetical protein